MRVVVNGLGNPVERQQKWSVEVEAQGYWVTYHEFAGAQGWVVIHVLVILKKCYVRIPKESGRCRERKVGGSEARPADSY